MYRVSDLSTGELFYTDRITYRGKWIGLNKPILFRHHDKYPIFRYGEPQNCTLYLKVNNLTIEEYACKPEWAQRRKEDCQKVITIISEPPQRKARWYEFWK